ncbi:MAG: hypothetical protein L0215_20210 [Gemmataceae bacterium]|nr:hypothetical protein [Gemmataceae bacterium]
MTDTGIQKQITQIVCEPRFDSIGQLPVEACETIRVPSIRKPVLSADAVLGYLFLSAFLSSVSVWLGPIGLSYGPGIVFAVLAVWPWGRAAGLHPMLIVATMILSPLGYHVAVSLFFHGWWCLSGVVGPALMLAPALVGGSNRVRVAAIKAIAAGWIIGLLFLCWPLAYFGLIGIWQWCVGVCLCTSCQVRVDDDY